MAAVTRLRRGTRVRLKVGYTTRLGNYIEPGTEGTVGNQRPLKPFFGSDEGVMIWVNVKARNARGWWLPARYLVRLKNAAS